MDKISDGMTDRLKRQKHLGRVLHKTTDIRKKMAVQIDTLQVSYLLVCFISAALYFEHITKSIMQNKMSSLHAKIFVAINQ